MPEVKMPVLACAGETKFVETQQGIDKLISCHQRTITLLMELKKALFQEVARKSMPDKKRKEVVFDRQTLTSLKRSYTNVIKLGRKPEDTFTFQGDVYLVSYAKYLIEFLESKLK